MRRLAGWTLLFVFVLSLFGCGKTGGDMRVRGIDSEIYTDEDYLAAVQAVIGWYLARKNGGKWNIVTCGYG